LDRLEINDEVLATQDDQTLGSVTEECDTPSSHDLKSSTSTIHGPGDTGERRRSRVTPSTQKFIRVKLPERPDSEFESVIKQKICNELEADEAQFLKIGLLQYLPSAGDDATTTPELVNKLCQLNADDAIEGVLYNATMECLRGSLKRKANKHRAEIKNIAEQVLGWLVLFSVDGEKLNQLIPDEEYFPGIYFMLPVTTETGVEIIVSRKFQRQSSLKVSSKGSNVEGNCLVPFDPKWVGWEQDDAVTEVIRMFWNKVFPADKKETGEIINEGKLNEMIQVRREDKWTTEHYYLITEDRLIPENGHLKRVFQDLLNRLPQLTVACIAGDSSGGLLFVSEDTLQAKIINFITRINEALGKTA
jgi:hypothetical protein